ncbi:tRNA synthetases class I (C) catalytic domain-containing protein [Pholiota molesta]|nr:tRNA synthetases class I (C) catalytic domain-containing protein [Pholiota molesta]
MSLQQPPWSIPEKQTEEPVLRVYNSLTRTKNEFVPRNGRHVKWYNCGPTVYDASHMGHARNYVTQDILRRIMTDYFGYDVHFVMNVTDIDDKIIERARQNHLLENFRLQTQSLTQTLLANVNDAWKNYVRTRVSKGVPENIKATEGTEEAAWSQINGLYQSLEWKQECLKRDEKFDMYYTSARRTLDAIASAQSELEKGNTSAETAHRLIDESKDILSIFLDAQYKSTVTDPAISRKLAAYWEGKFFEDMARLRVRDPDIVTRVTEYVPEIVAFVEKIISNGYAYEAEGSVYFNTIGFGHTGNRDLLEGGEGQFLASKTGRRSTADFALWKASKPGEPSWPSPWGPGRPGWHIECSVMASAIFGDNMESIPEELIWHFRIMIMRWRSLKMSKSLKNFITIEEILEKFTARQLRLAFLTQLWNAKVILYQAQTAFRVALCDSFNTPAAIDVLRDLISKTNVYINSRGKALNVGLVENIARWVGDMLRMFGLGEGETRQIGWGQVDETGGNANREETLMPYLRTLSSFPMAKGDTALKDILALCDKLRDSILRKSARKISPPAELIKAREEKRAIAEAKAAKKAASVEAERQKRLAKIEKGRVSPQDMFKPPNVPEGTYGSWNEQGLPLTDGEGKELTKNQSKKVQKEHANQAKLHEEFLAWQKDNTPSLSRR